MAIIDHCEIVMDDGKRQYCYIVFQYYFFFSLFSVFRNVFSVPFANFTIKIRICFLCFVFLLFFRIYFFFSNSLSLRLSYFDIGTACEQNQMNQIEVFNRIFVVVSFSIFHLLMLLSFAIHAIYVRPRLLVFVWNVTQTLFSFSFFCY